MESGNRKEVSGVETEGVEGGRRGRRREFTREGNKSSIVESNSGTLAARGFNPCYDIYIDKNTQRMHNNEKEKKVKRIGGTYKFSSKIIKISHS